MKRLLMSLAVVVALLFTFSYVNSTINNTSKKKMPRGIFAFRWGNIDQGEGPDSMYLAFDSITTQSELAGGVYGTYKIAKARLVDNKIDVSQEQTILKEGSSYKNIFSDDKKTSPWEKKFSEGDYDYTVANQGERLIGIRVNRKKLYSESIIIKPDKKIVVLWKIKNYYSPHLSPSSNGKLVVFMGRKSKKDINLIDENTRLNISTPVYNLKTGKQIANPSINGRVKWKQDDNVLAYLRTVDPNKDPVLEIINFNN